MSEPQTSTRRAVGDIALYATARLLLVAALSVVIYVVGRLLGIRDFPPIVALLFALIVALPMGIWVFAPLRRRATASVEAVSERRRRDRDQLRARLRGEEPPE
ncbi:DUF4229 domain-containing protein [Mycobacterium talmoniae]|uniref:DUF4229 domain-containing protein n=1 Tax=Mycobacterium talmoniae TaxID=1858794 RepID=A0A1S1MNS3_9MYCO|nr:MULTISPECIES: DUF4229 domain-containing protein [Mycobacterium]OHU87252.1 hypothetical protein BKN37_26030 [Mycobacterium talmoniae]PQM44531.1 hypothetical protein C1Y40_05309 [Mycobacterium talmoniae]TDH55135.1 DUF4229 domain-containing protein [Mycobacterium eburneum]